jgi:hypothetical protein
MFGRHPDGTEEPAAMDLVRLAIPRRTYTQSHVDYVIEVCEHVAAHAGELRGLRIVEEPPALRHLHGSLRATLIRFRSSASTRSGCSATWRHVRRMTCQSASWRSRSRRQSSSKA